jgi:hypothetical protein
MSHTTFLYARPSFIGGVARLLDFGGTLKVYNTTSGSEYMPDLRAFQEDWKAIAEDARAALAQYKVEYSLE